MMKKIKEWFAIENNFNLVRDCLFVGILLFALIAGLIFCVPRASAAELDFPEESTESAHSTYVATNIFNRFKMGPYIDLDENGISKYDGKYFTGELFDYFSFSFTLLVAALFACAAFHVSESIIALCCPFAIMILSLLG